MKTPVQVPTSPSEPVRKVAMALLGSVPMMGNMLQLTLDQIWGDPSYVFLKKYVQGIAADLARLEEEKVVNLEEVFKKPETRPLLIRAFEAAYRSIGEQKIQALRAATVQGIFERIYSFDLSVMVFSLLDRITERHIQMLIYMRARQVMPGGGGATLDSLKSMDIEFSDDGKGQLKPSPTLYEQYFDEHVIEVNSLVAADLENMGLIAPRATNPTGDWITRDDRLRFLTEKGELLYEHIVVDATQNSSTS